MRIRVSSAKDLLKYLTHARVHTRCRHAPALFPILHGARAHAESRGKLRDSLAESIPRGADAVCRHLVELKTASSR